MPLLITVGNIYIDTNLHGIHGGDAQEEAFTLKSGRDYFGTHSEQVLGGSAVNAAMQAGRLGVEVAFVGKTGADEGGREVRTLLDKEGILSELVSEDPKLTTSMAFNLIDTSGQFVGVHCGDASKTLAASDIDLDNELFNRSQAVYFGGTAKQPHLLRDGEGLFHELRGKGLKVFYDPNRFPVQEVAVDRNLIMAQLAHVEGYFPNEEELLQLTDATSIDEALDIVMGTGVTFIALKLGAKGCRIKTKDNDFTVGGHKITPMTTVGAGDCFNATFIASYLKDASLETCAQRATAAAAIKVGQNIWPDTPAIEALLSNGSE